MIELYSNSDRVFETVSAYDSRLRLVMPRDAVEREERELIGFPPRDTWLVNPDTDKIDTPVDDRGFVDVDRLIQAVKATIDPSYQWPDKINEHHFYWEEEWYHSQLIGARALHFRELPVHKALLPIEFHCWLHRITIPPDVPDPELIRIRNMSWGVAKDLFNSSREYVRFEKRVRRRAELIERKPEILPVHFGGIDRAGQEYIEQMSQKHFEGIRMTLDRLDLIPEEDRFVDIDAEPHEIAATLGRIIVPVAMKLTNAIAA
jgi:hypothetical protein